MRAKSLTGPVVGLYAVRILLGATIFAVLLVSLLSIKRDATRSHETSDTLIQALDVEQSVTQLDASLRTYLLSGNRATLAPFEGARRVLPSQLRALLTDAGTAGARAQASALVADVERVLNRYAVPLASPGTRLTSAATLARARAAGTAATALQARFAAFVQVFGTLRDRRHSAVTTEVTLAIIVAAVGLGLWLVLELIFQLFLVRGVLRPIRRVSLAAARLTRGELSARVPSTGLGEVATLGDAFNTMAQATQERTTEVADAHERLAAAAALAEEASAMKSEFVATITHEIRTPLNGLVGMLSLLSESSLDEEQLNYVEIARSSSDALLRVLGDVLDIAKIEAGRLEIERFEFDLHDTVESVCDLMSASAAAKHVSLQPILASEVPREVVGDRTRVAQVLQNLVSNAVKFTPAGEVTVAVSVESSDARSLVVVFEVHDTGIGVARDRLADLFEPFVQADPATARTFGGTGLGLAIVRQLTELMGGTISVQSTLGEGATFRFSLPLGVVGGRRSAPDRRLAGRRLLVVDPSPNVRRALTEYATAAGMTVTAVTGVDEAIGASRSDGARPADVVVIDASLGLPAMAELAHAMPETGDAAVVLLTPPSSLGQCDGAGESIRVAKPVRRARLLAALVSAVDGPPPAAEPGMQDRVPARRGAAAHRTGRRVLVADDYDINWIVMERMLTSRGHQSERARDGQQVLSLIRERPYDLILLDCQMPGLDGYDTARALRRLEHDGALSRGGDGPGEQRLPIVAITAETLEGARERCLDAGMDDYLAKPIELASLDAILERWLPPDPERMLDHGRIDVLHKLFSGNELQGMLAEMRADIERDLAELGTALRQRDQARVAAAAHRIRNTGALLGADGLVASAAELDRPPRPDRPPVAFDDGALERLQTLWESTRSELTELAD